MLFFHLVEFYFWVCMFSKGNCLMFLPITLLHAINFDFKNSKESCQIRLCLTNCKKNCQKYLFTWLHIVQPCYMEDWRTAVTVRERRRRTPPKPLYSLMTGCPSNWITRLALSRSTKYMHPLLLSIEGHYTLLHKHASLFFEMIIHFVDCQLGATVTT